MRVTVNGERKDVTATCVGALLAELAFEGTHFAIAVNYDVVPRARWSQTRLAEGDMVEILTPRQGG
jgi:sulfur carrier protein